MRPLGSKLDTAIEMCPVFGALFVSAQRIAGHAFSAHFMSYQYKSFATSVEISIARKASFPNIIKFSYCPYCSALHAWTPDEAFFNDPYKCLQ